ncbi:MAG: peptidylprolyl isomerase [Proteobacteria bacterium]|nr:peptidylprolyl isomerase [Pseudomonadota bacterium]
MIRVISLALVAIFVAGPAWAHAPRHGHARHPVQTSAAASVQTNAQTAAQTTAQANDWHPVDPENMLLIDVKYGQIVVELAPQFAPEHVARMKALARAHFFDGTSFYRVIDGFVAQGGIGEGTASTKDQTTQDDPRRANWPNLKAEFDRPISTEPSFTPLGNGDLFAQQVGHTGGFPVGRDLKEKRTWIIHCPGTFAFARDNKADTASTEFYIVIGEAPRRLDRNLTAFGRVLDGMQYLQKLERGDPAIASGVIQDKDRADKIVKIRVAADVAPADRPGFEVMRTDTKAFAETKKQWKNPAPDFYVRTPPPIIDICLKPVPVRRVALSAPG